MNRAFLDYFRCPDEYGRFSPLSAGKSPNNAEGYGPVSTAANGLEAHRRDANKTCYIGNGVVHLPFNPTLKADTLRHEYYAGESDPRLVRGLVRKAYYGVRPLLPVAARKHLQRRALRGWESISFPSWPVDTSVDALMLELMGLVIRAHDCEPIPFIWFWPDGHQAACIMTHDVETASGRDFCPRLMDITAKHGFRSSFQVVPETQYEVSNSYRTEVLSRGFELNLHGLNHDGNLFRNWGEFLNRVERINSYAREWGTLGFRSPVLYRNPEWMFALDKFEYDMSFPNVGHLDPQRGGCCTVMPYFLQHLVELPLTTTQDYTLFHILKTTSLDLWMKQIRIAIDNHGLVSFIVHPDYIIRQEFTHLYHCLLESLCETAQQEDVWCSLPRDIASWWRDRSIMSLERTSDGDWCITGPSSDRAHTAYAFLDGDKVVFTLKSVAK